MNELINLEKLPILEHKGEFQVEVEEMNEPIMLYTDDSTHEKYIVLAIRGHGNYTQSNLKGKPPVSELRGALRLNLNSEETRILTFSGKKHAYDMIWGIGNPWTIKNALDNYHNKNGDHIGTCVNICDTCPEVNDWYKLSWVKNLLEGNDPLFKVSL